MRWYKAALVRALEASNGEREIHAFLKRHPQLIVTAFNWGWNHVFLVPEFQLGTHLRADFVLFGGHSGGWNVRFVELEPVGARLYLADGTPARQLRTAQKQISDWREYRRIHEQHLRDELSHAMVSKNIYAVRHKGVSRYLEKRIRDPHEYIQWYGHIIIGRRARLSSDEQQRRSRGIDLIDAEIATYDRLVDAAERIDSANRELIAHHKENGRCRTPLAWCSHLMTIVIDLHA